VNADYQQAALWFTALLSDRRDLTHHVRSSIIARACPFDSTSHDAVIPALSDAFGSLDFPMPSRQWPRPDVLDRAAATVDLWIKRGVFVIGSDQCLAPGVELHELPRVWFAWGNRSVLESPAAAILNSRKPRNTRPGDGWIRTVKTMVCSVMHRGFVVASSYGTLGHSLVSLMARASPVLIACDHVLPFMGSPEVRDRFLSESGDLFDMENTLFLSTFPPGRLPDRAARWAERDHLVAASASLLLAADVRAGGNMERILEIAAGRHIPVETFSTGAHCHPKHGTRKVTVSPERYDASESPRGTLPRNVERPAERKRLRESGTRASARPKRSIPIRAEKTKIPFAEDFAVRSSYLIHYTRGCPGPWPGETMAQYGRTLLDEEPEAAHTAFDTLFRILDQGMIRASRRLIRGTTPVVCFTELFPGKLQDLTAWRSGLLRWSFEPYGVALRKEPLFRLGALPVIYAVDAAFRDLNPELRHLFQLQSACGMTWSEEKEWRIAGDLPLAGIEPRDMFVIVPTSREARIIGDTFGCRVALAAFGTGRSDRRR
jgi:hypothetical protein